MMKSIASLICAPLVNDKLDYSLCLTVIIWHIGWQKSQDSSHDHAIKMSHIKKKVELRSHDHNCQCPQIL